MKKSLAQNAAFNVAYNMLNVVFPLISTAYISRVLEPEGIGRVAAAQNIVSYFLMFATLGIPQYGTREIAKRQDTADATNRLFSELMVVNIISTALCTTMYYLFVGIAFQDKMPLYLVCGLSLILNFINVDWFFQGKEEYVYITLRSALVKVLSILALFVFVKVREDVIAYALILCLGTGCNSIFNIFHIRKKVRVSFRNLNLRRHVKPILLLMLSSVAASLYNKVDVTILSAVATEASVGYYTSAHKVVTLVLTLVTAISAVFLPRLSYTYQSDRQKFNEYLSTGLKIVLLLAVPGCMGLVLVAEDLTAILFGELFLPTANIIRILSVFTVIKGAGDLLCYQVVISTGHEDKLVRSRVAAGVVNVLLNAILIPRYAHNGAAAVAVISELIVNGIMLRYALTIVKPKIGRRFYGSLILSTLAMGAAVLPVRYLTDSALLNLMVSVVAGVVVFVLMIRLTKNEILEELLKKRKKGKSEAKNTR
jgi:O-antigen/teichoic acid export membrane protein